MDYQSTLSWMFKQLPMYQRIGAKAYKIDLSNTLKLATHLSNPHTNFKSVHVAGTNGKGSVCHILASVLQEAGYKTGLYTSPHLKDFRERIKINGKKISKEFVVDFIAANKSFLEANKLSFFEMTVGMAFDFFAKENVDIAIIEVGLGGRLDSTNIITPEVSVITNISLDHTNILGNTLEAIAVEKAGIIKETTPVVIGETHLKTEQVFINKANSLNSRIFFADKLEVNYESDLKGLYQKNNIKTAIQTLRVLQNLGFSITDDAIISGIKNIVKNTGLLGRWQILQENPKVICDTAHNKEGLKYVVKQIAQEDYNNLHIIFGVVKDKDLDSILRLLPKHAYYHLAKPNIERGLDVKDLKLAFDNHGFKSVVYNSVASAYKSALAKARHDDLIYVGGSTFVVAEVV